VFGDKGNELKLPTYKALVATVKPVEAGDKKLSWKPERCGGYEMKMNFDPLIDYGQNSIAVDISTKKPCENDSLSEVLYCSITLDGSKLTTEPCSMAGGGDDLDDVVANLQKPEDAAEPAPEDAAPAHH
jgi:hypothetical protein